MDIISPAHHVLSSCLPQVHHPSAVSPCHASTFTNSSRLLYSLLLYPHIAHFSFLASTTITASITPTGPNISISKHACSSTEPYTPMSYLQLHWTAASHLSMSAAHHLFGSSAQGTAPVLCLEGDMERSARSGAEV